MSYIIQESDKRLIKQNVLNLRVRIDVYDKDSVYIDTLECGLVSGTCNIDAASDIRRTASFVLIPMKKVNTLIEEDSMIWINRNIVLSIGVQRHRDGEYIWYQQGWYVIQTYNSTYDATNNQLTINCCDWTAKLDGTKNGQLGALITEFPAYKEYYEGAEDNHLFETVTYSNNIYSVTLEDYSRYKSGDYMLLKIPTDNAGNARFQVNSLPALQITDLTTGQRISAGAMKAGYYYTLLITSVNTAALTNQIPLEDVYDGVPLNYYIIRDGVITALERLGDIHSYNIDDIGEYQAMPQYNSDYLAYREENPLWNNIPYDLEFTVGDNVLSILNSFRDLYPNYEMFFDTDNTYVARMIPSADADDPWITNDFLQEILISENFSIDTTTVRNVTEVFGASLDTDYTASSCSLSGTTYTIEVDEYGGQYYTGDLIAIAFDATNPADASIQIHTTYTDPDSGEVTVTLEPLTLLDQMTDKALASGVIEAGALYVCKVKTRIENGYPVKHFYFLSQYQPQAINVLTDGTVSDEDYECADGRIVKKYSLDYFKDFYNCRVISFTIDTSSAFTIQKLGVLLNVFSGGEFENIESDQRALARAEWENWKTARLTDSITITTKICPFLDVNKKVSFKRSDKELPEDYIIQSVAHDTAGGTSSITMYRFRSLYKEQIDAQTYDDLTDRTHNSLTGFTYAEIGGQT